MKKNVGPNVSNVIFDENVGRECGARMWGPTLHTWAHQRTKDGSLAGEHARQDNDRQDKTTKDRDTTTEQVRQQPCSMHMGSPAHKGRESRRRTCETRQRQTRQDNGRQRQDNRTSAPAALLYAHFACADFSFLLSFSPPPLLSRPEQICQKNGHSKCTDSKNIYLHRLKILAKCVHRKT